MAWAIILVSFFSAFLQASLASNCTNWVTPDFTVDYIPRGRIFFIAGMDTYVTGNGSKALIAVYDNNGFAPARNNTRQMLDRIAELGYTVILPDFFHGEPWKKEHHVEGNDEGFLNFVRATSWNEPVRVDLGLVLEHYKSIDFNEFGIFGFSFGGKIAAKAVDEYADDIKIAAQFHPEGIDIYDAMRTKRPSILLPGADDRDMTYYCEIIDILFGAGSCVYYHFTDVNHGFAGSEADWSNATVVGNAQKAVNMFEKFLCDKFPPT